MKKIILLALSLFALAGCEINSGVCHYDSNYVHHCHGDDHAHSHHDTTTVVYTSANNGGGYNNNIIVVEEEPSWCSWDYPYYHDPEWCTFDYDTTCCMWLNIGSEEQWCYYDYCGWELVSVYEYYQEEERMKLKQCPICLLPFPSTSLVKLRNIKVCANCYVQNKRMFREW